MRTGKLNRLLAVGVAAAAMGWAAGASAQSADLTTELLVAPCAACHGPDGTSVALSDPTIANLSVEYFVNSMIAYKTDTRPSTIMNRIAKGYSDKQIETMAHYFQKKPFGRPPQPFDGAKAKEGKALAKKYCESCHEDEGRLGEGVGVLAGQKLIYMEYAIDDFLSGKRDMEKRQKQKFDALMADHGREAFTTILNYYASVK